MKLNLAKYLITLAAALGMPPMVEAPWIAVLLVLVAPVFYKPYCKYVGNQVTFIQVALASAFVMCLNAFWINMGVGAVMWTLLAAAFLDALLRESLEGKLKKKDLVLGAAYLLSILAVFVAIYFIKLSM